MSQVADFLLYLREKLDIAVPTIKCYRSMLSIVFRHRGLALSDNKDLHDLTSPFKTSKVPQLISPAWNLDVMLKFLMFSPFEPLHSASLKDVTRNGIPRGEESERSSRPSCGLQGTQCCLFFKP